MIDLFAYFDCATNCSNGKVGFLLVFYFKDYIMKLENKIFSKQKGELI